LYLYEREDNLTRIITICNIEYLINQPLIGTLFQLTVEPEKEQPRVQINTQFYTDHAEHLEALTKLAIDMERPLGLLLEGHEFIVMFPVRSSRKKVSNCLNL
jgi:hypothetical protein